MELHIRAVEPAFTGLVSVAIDSRDSASRDLEAYLKECVIRWFELATISQVKMPTQDILRLATDRISAQLLSGPGSVGSLQYELNSRANYYALDAGLCLVQGHVAAARILAKLALSGCTGVLHEDTDSANEGDLL
jgi:hypothetical protein